jgi:ketosteroid isomerase-like protein
MENIPDTKLGRMYRDHIGFAIKKDIDKLLDQYTDDCLLIRSINKKPEYFRGHDGLREHFEGLLAVDGLDSDIAFWAETENPQTLMIVEAVTMKTAQGEAKMRFADSWVLREGRIAIHFAGLTQYPDGTIA